MRSNMAWLDPDPEVDRDAEIRSFFVDNEKRKWTFAYKAESAQIGVAEFREVVVAGKTIDDPVHLLTAFSKAQTLFRISTYDPASDWLWACFRATRDYRKGKYGKPVSPVQPGVIRRKKKAKKPRKGRR